MNTLILSGVVISVFGLTFLSVDAGVIKECPPCPQNKKCPFIYCPCGTVEEVEVCQCCNVCRRCPRDSCSLMNGEVCKAGHVCTHARGLSEEEMFNSEGTFCVPLSEVLTEK